MIKFIFFKFRPSKVSSSSDLQASASAKTPSRKLRPNVLGSESSDSSENEGTPPDISSPAPLTPEHSSALPDQLEKCDRISKEKQKFFRLSAIFADKKKKKKEQALRTAETSNRAPKVVPSSEQLKHKPAIEVVTKASPPVKVAVSKRTSLTKSHTRTSGIVPSDNCKSVLKPSEKPAVRNKVKSNKSEVISNNKPRTSVENITKSSTTAAAKSSSKSISTSKKTVIPLRLSSSSESDDNDEEKSSSDSSECCSSSGDDESSSSDSDSDSSNHSESSRISIGGTKIKLPTASYSSTNNISTFGSISGINDTKEQIWGFAAAVAAAEPNKKHFINVTSSKSDNKFGDSPFNLHKINSNFSFLDDKNSSSSSTFSSSNCDRQKPGFGQLKGLFDGLSHLFTTPDHSRSRTGPVPNYNLNRRKRSSEKDNNSSPPLAKKTHAGSKKEQELPDPEKSCNKAELDVVKSKTILSVSKPVAPRPAVAIKHSEPKIDRIDSKALKKLMGVTQKPENGIANIVTKHTNITIPPKIPKRVSLVPTQSPDRRLPRPGIFLPSSEDEWAQMTPSNLVKTAVNSKRHEFERRRFLKGEAPYCGMGYMGFSHSSFLEEVRMKKRNLIAEATQINHPLSVPQPSNNQTGKMGHRALPYPSALSTFYRCSNSSFISFYCLTIIQSGHPISSCLCEWHSVFLISFCHFK